MFPRSDPVRIVAQNLDSDPLPVADAGPLWDTAQWLYYAAADVSAGHAMVTPAANQIVVITDVIISNSANTISGWLESVTDDLFFQVYFAENQAVQFTPRVPFRTLTPGSVVRFTTSAAGQIAIAICYYLETV